MVTKNDNFKALVVMYLVILLALFYTLFKPLYSIAVIIIIGIWLYRLITKKLNQDKRMFWFIILTNISVLNILLHGYGRLIDITILLLELGFTGYFIYKYPKGDM